MRFKTVYVVAISTCFLMLVSCKGDRNRPSPAETAEIRVLVNIAPQAYFVEQIGGKYVEVDALVGKGESPHTFQPTPKQVISLGKAEIYFRSNMPFEERLLSKIRGGTSDLRVVNITRDTETSDDHNEEVEHHEHGTEHEEHGHSHGGHMEGDPHVWLSPPKIKHQARRIAHALTGVDPGHKAAYKENLEGFLEKVDRLHTDLKEKLAPYKGRAFYVFHPAFHHFAEAYGLEQKAVQAGGHTPSAKQLRALIQQARADNVRAIFVQPQFDKRSANRIAEAIGGSCVTIDPLKKNVLDNLREIADKVTSALATASSK
ncbi:MAG: zinc ABC transporter substrate-binding protein [Planctomycetes bacterium]|nr:zinc ABC transporter substrate-binding protein [Planctomycetota bacterium]